MTHRTRYILAWVTIVLLVTGVVAVFFFYPVGAVIAVCAGLVFISAVAFVTVVWLLRLNSFLWKLTGDGDDNAKSE